MKLLVAFPLLLAGCDRDEGVSEEAREVTRAVEREARPARLQAQLQDVGDAIMDNVSEAERELGKSIDALEVRIADARQSPQQDPQHRQELDALSLALARARNELQQIAAVSPEDGKEMHRLTLDVERVRQKLDSLGLDRPSP